MASEREEAPRPVLQRTCVCCGHAFVPDGELYCDGCGVRARSAERVRNLGLGPLDLGGAA